MGTPLLNDEAIEAFFLGTDESSWEDDEALLTLAVQVSVAVGGPPPRPHGALLALLEGAAPAAPTAPALAVVPTLSPAAAAIRQPRKVPTDPRLLSRRLWRAASIAAGIGIAAATVTVAGTTGVLPDPAMRTVARVVQALTPFELSESTKPLTIVPGPQPPTTWTVPAPHGTGSWAPGGSAPQPSATTATTRPPSTAPTTVQGPVQPGSTGVDRAGQTPAAPFIPPFVSGPPGSSGDSTPPSTGVDRARETPAGGSIPPVAGGVAGRR